VSPIHKFFLTNLSNACVFYRHHAQTFSMVRISHQEMLEGLLVLGGT
jgi:hypothetical protein